MTNILEVEQLKKHFPIRRGILRKVVGQVKAVDGVSLAIRKGETLSLVGESGCGKTTVSRCIVRALHPTSGVVRFRLGDGPMIDIASLNRKGLSPLRSHMQMIFQDPFSSLNPRMTVMDIIGEPLLVNGMTNLSARRARVRELLEVVQLPAQYLNRFPHAFSGGQRQRIGIARALALNPALIVADEPVSALDVSVQAQIVNLLGDLQERLGLALLFISHDLSVVEHLSDRVVVLYLGRIMEIAPARAIYARPFHPYTQALLSAAPVPDPDAPRARILLQGDLPSPAAPPSGCVFRTRCPHAIAECARIVPPLEELAPGRRVACIRARELPVFTRSDHARPPEKGLA